MLLQAIWNSFVLAVDYVCISQREDLKYGEDCARDVMEQPGIPLGSVKPQREGVSRDDET